mgnify:CR=1 FL=1
MAAAPVFALLLAISAAQRAAGEVAMVWAVTRHGTRNVLPKSANLTEGDATCGPTLLPKGVVASMAAGGWGQGSFCNGAARARFPQTLVA